MKWNQALTDYKYYLKIERGLSKNSIDSYSLDVVKLIDFLEKAEANVSPISIDQDTLQNFIYSSAKRLNARSQSRLISGLRSFFSYLRD